MTNTTLKKTFAVAVLAAAAALVATPAQAQPATQPRVVEVTANADGLVAPGVATLRPGATTFRVTTPDSVSRYVAVVGLRPGVALDTFLDNMTTVLFSNDEEAKRLAGAQVARDMTRGRVGCDERRVPLVECEESVVHRTTGCGAGPTRAMLTCGRDIMSYVHDIGGLHGFGPVPGRDDEVSFHAAWEARIFAILRSLIHNKVFTWDEFRHAIERMDTGAYFATSYYERWADAVERICVEKGVLSEDERGAVLAAMRAEPT